VSETLLTRRGFAGALSGAACLSAGVSAPRNFELEAEICPRPGIAAGIRFHKRFEIRIGNGERGKTGSLTGLRHVYKAFLEDGQWGRLQATVRGGRVLIRINGMTVVDYADDLPVTPAPAVLKGPNHVLASLKVREIPDAPAPELVKDETARRIADATRRGIPMADLHVHLKLGLTLEQAVAKSLKDGIQYGIAVNCGKGFPVETDAGARAFFDSLKGAPVFRAMQAEGREWVGMFSKDTIRQFDYVFTDSMTWTDNHGKRMRTWLPAEVGTIADPQEFMETLVERAVGILETEHVNIYVNPTFLPDQIARDYETLWTEKRRKRVIDAAVKNHVAVEINNRYKLPSPSFIKMAKAAGAKFTFGTNNTAANDLGRCEYGLQMIEECKLDAKDFWTPA
jgi:hypothetical protein